MRAGPQPSVLDEEIARFDALAARWWDPAGPMRPLHRMNPARIGWIMQRISRRHADPRGLRLLDVGCGAGLAAEALARQGLAVLGIDAAGEVIEAARAHAAGHELPLVYRTGAVEDLLSEGLHFPVIAALEVIEHVADPTAFLRSLAALLEPGGLLFLSTLNRTTRSLLLAKIGAEYVLRWLPRGTHDWQRFLTPAELAAGARLAGLRPVETAGLSIAPLAGGWTVSRDLSVNYLMLAEAA